MNDCILNDCINDCPFENIALILQTMLTAAFFPRRKHRNWAKEERGTKGLRIVIWCHIDNILTN